MQARAPENFYKLFREYDNFYEILHYYFRADIFFWLNGRYSEAVLSVLTKGIHYAITKNRMPTDDMICGELMKNREIRPGDYIVSFYIISLFTNVPIKKHQKLSIMNTNLQDTTWT